MFIELHLFNRGEYSRIPEIKEIGKHASFEQPLLVRVWRECSVKLRMPEMGGEEPIREIRKIDPQIPVVVVTGSPEWLTEELKAQIQGWIYKPFRLKELGSLVRDLLEARKRSNCDHRITDCATGEMKI